MKKELLSGVAAIAMFAAAGGSTPAAAQETFDWTGLYIGGHVGYGEANYDGGKNLGFAQFLADDLDLDGFAGGGHVGFNYQFDQSVGGVGNLVIGIEGDGTWTDWQDTFRRSPVASEAISGDVDLLASVRARLGVAVDNSLVYVTGGIAIPDAEYMAFDSDGAGSVDFNDIGGVVGGGVAFAATDMLSFRVEGLYYIFDDRHNTVRIIDPAIPDIGGFAEFDDAFVVRVGVSIHLGGLLDAM